MINTLFTLTSSTCKLVYQGTQSVWSFAIRNPKIVFGLALMTYITASNAELIIPQKEGSLTVLKETEETTILCFDLKNIGNFAYRMLYTPMDHTSNHLETLNSLIKCGLKEPRNLANIIPIRECLEKAAGQLFSSAGEAYRLVEAINFEDFCTTPSTHSGL